MSPVIVSDDDDDDHDTSCRVKYRLNGMEKHHTAVCPDDTQTAFLGWISKPVSH